MQADLKNIATPAQIRRLWAEALSLRLDGDELALVIHRVTGKETLEELTGAEAGRVIRRLRRASAQDEAPAGSAPPEQPTSSQPPSADRDEAHEVSLHTGSEIVRLMSRWQGETIALLLSELDLPGDSVAFRALARRACGRSRPRTHSKAEKLIEALKVLRGGIEGVGNPRPAA